MDTREKLIELLMDSETESIPNEDGYYVCHLDRVKAKKYADHLIVHGVTVQQWIPVAERLPDGRYDVLVSRIWWNERKPTQIGWYNEVAGNWYILTEDGYVVNDKVTNWMPLPEAPKGD